MEHIPKVQASQSQSPRAGARLYAVSSPDIPADHTGATTWGIPQKRRGRNADHHARWAAVDLKGVTDVADFHIFPPSPESKPQDRIRQLRAERGEIAMLTLQIHSLQTQNASLQQENSWLDSEIEQLKLKLQKTQEEQNQHILQLHRKHFQGQGQLLEMTQILTSVYRDKTFTCHFHNHCRNMA